jgi:hypothetical protein
MAVETPLKSSNPRTAIFLSNRNWSDLNDARRACWFFGFATQSNPVMLAIGRDKSPAAYNFRSQSELEKPKRYTESLS